MKMEIIEYKDHYINPEKVSYIAKHEYLIKRESGNYIIVLYMIGGHKIEFDFDTEKERDQELMFLVAKLS